MPDLPETTDTSDGTDSHTPTQPDDQPWRELRHREAMRRDEERWAAELLHLLLKSERWEARDFSGGPEGMHDFDLVFGDGRRIAVEVKIHPAHQPSAFDVERRQRTPICATSLQSGWMVDFDVSDDELADADAAVVLFDEVSSKIEALLARVERDGLQDHVRDIRSASGGAASLEHPICTELRGLRIGNAFPAPWITEGTIRLSRGAAIVAFAPSTVSKAIQRHLACDYAILRRAKDLGADEAHLFLWMPLGVSRSETAGMKFSPFVPDDAWLPPRLDLDGYDCAWVSKFTLPVVEPEIQGFTSPIWQLSDSGWHCWTRDWRPSRHEMPA
ncbi:MAG: hypothetical protein OXB99_14960 [Acidimicrobiaceae bacterium]|nr:hypothetical protein [Acidimicrobiaceae bacterium]